MRVAVVQFASHSDREANLVEIDRLLCDVPKTGVDLVVLPEAAAVSFGAGNLAEVAESVPGPFTDFLGSWARRLEAVVVAGMFEATSGLPHNSIVAVGADGSILLNYRKIHLFNSFGRRESDRIAPGPVEPAVLDVAGRRIGLMSCYDLRFPEMGRLLVDAEADLLLVPAAWLAGEHKDEQWEVLLRARAIENVCQVVAVNQTGTRYAGRSLLVNPQGTIVVRTDEDPGVTLMDVDVEEVLAARRENPSLDNRRIEFS